MIFEPNKEFMENLSLHIREINKESVRKRRENDPEHIRKINTQSVRKRKQNNIERVQEIDKQSFKKRKANNPEHIKQINRKSKEKLKKVSYFQTSDVFHDPSFQKFQALHQSSQMRLMSCKVKITKIMQL